MFCPLNYGRFVGTPGESRTPDILGRNQALLSTELQGRYLIVTGHDKANLCN